MPDGEGLRELEPETRDSKEEGSKTYPRPVDPGGTTWLPERERQAELQMWNEQGGWGWGTLWKVPKNPGCRSDGITQDIVRTELHSVLETTWA